MGRVLLGLVLLTTLSLLSPPAEAGLQEIFEAGNEAFGHGNYAEALLALRSSPFGQHRILAQISTARAASQGGTGAGRGRASLGRRFRLDDPGVLALCLRLQQRRLLLSSQARERTQWRSAHPHRSVRE